MTTLHEKFEKYIKETFSCPDDDIYHYTKKGKGTKIISSGFFRLTSHHDLNKKGDNGELIVGQELIIKYLKKSSLASQQTIFNEMIKRGITLHIGSFSEQKNNQHAIKEYGSDCLEFTSEYLKKLSEDHVLIGSVNYDPKKQNEIISTLFDLYEEQTDDDPAQKRCSLFQELLTIIPLLKEEKHHPDIECRMVTVHGREKNDQTKIIGTIKNQIKFSNSDVLLLRMPPS